MEMVGFLNDLDLELSGTMRRSIARLLGMNARHAAALVVLVLASSCGTNRANLIGATDRAEQAAHRAEVSAANAEAAANAATAASETTSNNAGLVVSAGARSVNAVANICVSPTALTCVELPNSKIGPRYLDPSFPKPGFFVALQTACAPFMTAQMTPPGAVAGCIPQEYQLWPPEQLLRPPVGRVLRIGSQNVFPSTADCAVEIRRALELKVPVHTSDPACAFEMIKALMFDSDIPEEHPLRPPRP